MTITAAQMTVQVRVRSRSLRARLWLAKRLMPISPRAAAWVARHPRVWVGLNAAGRGWQWHHVNIDARSLNSKAVPHE